MSNNTKNKLELYSNDKEIKEILNNIKTKDKIYKRLIDVLNILGDFNNKVEVNLYEIRSSEEECYIKLWFTDNNDNIFIICPNSLNKNDLYKITKITNATEITYDVSLAKKFEINNQNINFIKTGNIHQFKYGRLITDELSFYSVYLGNNIGYQLETDSSEFGNLSTDILSYLNDLEKTPTFFEFNSMLEHLVKNSNIKLKNINSYAYKDFIKVGEIKIKDENKVNQSYIIKQKSK